MKMKPLSSAALALAATLFLAAGCANTPPTVGDRMIDQAEATKDLGKQWQRGQDLVKRGERIKAEGQELVATGEKKVAEGDRLINEGRALMNQSEAEYQTRFPGRTLQPKPAE